MIRDVQEIQALATKYSKQQLAHMAQMGMLDPTKAVMAGMMRDRISKEDAKPPTTTVAQDVMGIAPPQMGMQAPQEQPQQAPQGAPTGVASLPQEPQANAGIEALPAGDVGSYAGGGIVAFDDGGSVPGYAAGTPGGINSELIELQVELGDLQNQLATNPTNTKLSGKIKDLTRLIDLKKERLGVTTPVQPVGVASLPAAADVNPDAQVAKMEQERADARKAKNKAEGRTWSPASVALAHPLQGAPASVDDGKSSIAGEFLSKIPSGINELVTGGASGEAGRARQAELLRLQKELAAIDVGILERLTPEDRKARQDKANALKQQIVELQKTPVTPAAPAVPAASEVVPTFVSSVAPAAAAGAVKKVGAPEFVAPVGISGSTTKRPDINIPSTKIPYNEYTAPEARGLAAISKERRDQLAAMGVDENMISKMVGETEAKKEKLSGRKGEAQGEALMQMGLGLMGARRGQEFQTLGESGIKALQTYKSDMKDLRSAEEKLDDRRDTLRLAEQQAKRTGAESDIAKLDREKDRFEASKAAAAKERNDLEKSEAVLRMQGAQIKSYGDVSLYGTDVREETARQQLKVQSAQAANAANYQNRLLTLNEARINSMDAASKAKMIKLKQESDKMFSTSPEYMALQKQLKGEFGDNFMTADKAKVAIELAKKLYFAQQIEGLGGLSSMGAGILDESQLK